MSSNITINCDIEYYLLTTYERLIELYCARPTSFHDSESCIKLGYNLWATKLNYNRFCLNT